MGKEVTGLALLDSIRDGFGRVVYTHKTQEKAADLLAHRTWWLKLIELFLIVATATTVLTVLCGVGRTAEILASVFAAASLLVSIYQFRFNPEQIVLSHRTCARKLWGVRERYITLICDCMDGAVPDEQARATRDSLIAELVVIYETAPETSSKAYEKAKKALQAQEEMTFSDEEIDKFLPCAARKALPKAASNGDISQQERT